MKKFVWTWWPPLMTGLSATLLTIGVLVGEKADKLTIIAWPWIATVWTVLAEVRYRTGKLRGRIEEQERQQAWWH